jgi:hypothetical protein
MKRFLPIFLLQLIVQTSLAGLAITCGQSNANTVVAESFAGSLPGVNRPFTAMVGGQPIDVWLAPDGKGGYARGGSYLTELWDPGPAEAAAEKLCHETGEKDAIYFLWMHGESDSVTVPIAEAYEAKLRALLGFVREDFGFVKKLEMAVGLIWYVTLEQLRPAQASGVYCIRAIQRKVAEEFGAVWVDTASLTRWSDVEPTFKDDVHLNFEGEKPGTLRLGQVAAQAIRRKQNFHEDQGVYLVQGEHELRGVRGMRYLLESSADGITWKSCGSYRMPYVKGSENSAAQRLPWPAEAGPDDLKLRYRLTEVAP